MPWVYLDTNAWIDLADGTGPLASVDRARLLRILCDRSARRRYELFTSQPVEQELIQKAYDDPELVWRRFDLVNLATNGRILLHTETRTRLEVLQGGGHLSPQRRFVSGANRQRRISAFARRDIDQIRSYLDEVRDYMATEPLERNATVDKAVSDLERLCPGWREAWSASEADAEIAQKFVGERVDAYARASLPRPIDPRGFPTAYWSVRIWTARARRVLAGEGSPKQPGTYDHHVAVDAASYADVFVGNDGKLRERIIEAVAPPFRHYDIAAFAEKTLRGESL